jgi:hypothetical protein
MKSTHRSHRAFTRVRRIWNELAYAQRRLFEVQTGVAVGPRPGRRQSRQAEMLDDLFTTGSN